MIRRYCIEGAKECLPLAGIAAFKMSESRLSPHTLLRLPQMLRDKEILSLESSITGEIVKDTFSC